MSHIGHHASSICNHPLSYFSPLSSLNHACTASATWQGHQTSCPLLTHWDCHPTSPILLWVAPEYGKSAAMPHLHPLAFPTMTLLPWARTFWRICICPIHFHFHPLASQLHLTQKPRDQRRNDNWAGVTDSLTVFNVRQQEWARGRRFNKPRLMIWCVMSPLCCQFFSGPQTESHHD